MGSSLADLRAFPGEARRQAGYQLGRVQQGLMPSDWKPMASIGMGVYEIRVHTRTEHRVFYVAKFRESIYVLHAFEKRTRATSRGDLEMGKARFVELIRRRSTPQEVRDDEDPPIKR